MNTYLLICLCLLLLCSHTHDFPDLIYKYNKGTKINNNYKRSKKKTTARFFILVHIFNIEKNPKKKKQYTIYETPNDKHLLLMLVLSLQKIRNTNSNKTLEFHTAIVLLLLLRYTVSFAILIWHHTGHRNL